MMKKITLTIIWLLVAGFIHLAAQTKIVTGNVTITPPYSPYIEDYTSLGANKMRVMLLLKDTRRGQYNAKVRISITGAQASLQTRTPVPITLQGGVPLYLSGSDLLPMLKYDNLIFNGIAQEDYLRRKKMPDGEYIIVVEVMDARRESLIVSGIVPLPVSFRLSPPPEPFITRLEYNSTTKSRNLLRINSHNAPIQFEWTPRHAGFAAQYHLKVARVTKDIQDINVAVNSGRMNPIDGGLTQANVMVHTGNALGLQPGERYAFWVEAKNLEGRNLFMNEGRSRIVEFVYGEGCEAPIGLEAKATGPETVEVKFTTTSRAGEYVIQYRKAGAEKWYEKQTFLTTLEINQLEADTEYEFAVFSACGEIKSEPTQSQKIKTEAYALNQVQCGAPPPSYNMDNKAPKDVLAVGDVVKVADFEVKLTTVTGGSGNFSGEGYVVISTFNNVRLKVAFNNITVNTDNRMIAGQMPITKLDFHLLSD